MIQNIQESAGGPAPQRDPWGKRLITVADLPTDIFPTLRIPENRYLPLTEHGTKRAYHAPGSPEHHIRGILGEFAVADLFHVPNRVDTCIYEYGDPGFDFRLNGFRVDVKTAGPQENNPRLLVGADSEIQADLYILAQELSSRVYRVLGYAPADVVEDAPVCEFPQRIGASRVRVIKRDQLAPLPVSMVKHLGASFA